MIKRPVYLAAGGTGGHIFPALAVAETLQQRGHKTHLFTDRRGAELLECTPELPANLYVIAAASPFQKGLLKRAVAAIKLAIGAFTSLGHLLVKRPALIIGFGGYPSFAPLLAGRLLGIPILLHEQNAFLGRANYMLAKFADALALSWPNTKNLPPDIAHELTGIPVRQAFFDAAKTPYRLDSTTRVNLTVLGGSLGASILGSLIPDAIAMLEEPLRQRLHIHQQARPEQIDLLQKRYADLGVTAQLRSFFSDVPELLCNSHLVICRAGASSVAELAAIGRPALLLPLPNAMDNHQRVNALQMQDAGGGICLDETSVSAAALATRLIQLLDAPKTLSQMAKSAHSLASPDAANLIAALAEQLVGLSTSKQRGASA
jgi:UDP-N-acetylglucosamine--N-acetylmuramyl-(pentapeptide) pyrophosphoryl-undecaprenol N-acetylglucosamine transferase